MDKAGDILKSFLTFYQIEQGQTYSSFFSRWKEIVGDDLASHAKTVDIRKNSLLVEVDHPGWMQLLQMRQASVLKTIEKKYPELGIRGIHMRLVTTRAAVEGTAKRAAPPETPKPPKAEPAEEVLRPAGIDSIGDESLKALLLKLGRSISENDEARDAKKSEKK